MCLLTWLAATTLGTVNFSSIQTLRLRGFSWRLCSANMGLVESVLTTFSIFWALVCVSEEILIYGIKMHLVLVLVH